MKIVVLGPFYPYKGGIAQFTTQMSRALAKTHDVINISYSVQYPKLLFPRGEQKDYANTSLKVDNVYYWLNTVNPFSCVNTARKINKLKPDVILFQWVHPYFAPSYWLLCKFLSKKVNKLFLCHNTLPHEKIPMQKLLSRLVLKNADAFIVMSETEERNLRDLIDKSVVTKVNHPTYDLLDNRGQIAQKTARELLGLSDSDFVMLFFGYVREYKGLKVLLKAYPEVLAKNPHAVLIIGGEFNKSEKDEYLQLICEAQKGGGKIITVGDYIPDSDVGKYFSACDVAVLPYLSATQSGVVANAYTFGVPVITTNVGGLPEVVIDDETGYLVPPNDSGALADAILRFMNMVDRSRFSECIQRELQKYSWDRFVEAVEENQAANVKRENAN